jgi:hypothetical protein
MPDFQELCGRWRTAGNRYVAEREGFEPPIRLPVCRISSAVHSTTLPPLRRTVIYHGIDYEPAKSGVGLDCCGCRSAQALGFRRRVIAPRELASSRGIANVAGPVGADNISLHKSLHVGETSSAEQWQDHRRPIH